MCNGTYKNGPDKRYARCQVCSHVDYEANEGDRCRAPASTPARPALNTGSGNAARDAAYVGVRRAGGSPRAAVRAYCAGNRWATENAKGVGNW